MVEERPGWPATRLTLTAETVVADGSGNLLHAAAESENVTEVFTGLDRRWLPAEQVAGAVAEQMQGYLDSGVAVGAQLADRLPLPPTRSRRGRILTVEPTSHLRTSMEVLDRFFAGEVTTEPAGSGGVLLDCRSH